MILPFLLHHIPFIIGVNCMLNVIKIAINNKFIVLKFKKIIILVRFGIISPIFLCNSMNCFALQHDFVCYQLFQFDVYFLVLF